MNFTIFSAREAITCFFHAQAAVSVAAVAFCLLSSQNATASAVRNQCSFSSWIWQMIGDRPLPRWKGSGRDTLLLVSIHDTLQLEL
jgi:hypothetical protein